MNQQGFIIGNRELAELPDNIKIRNDFSFIDAQLKLSTQFDEKTRLEISALAAQNDFGDEIIDEAAGSIQMDQFDLYNVGASMKLFRNWNQHWMTTFKLIGSRYEYDYDYTLMDLDQTNVRVFGQKQNRISDVQFVWNNEYAFSDFSKLKLGYHFTQYDIDYTVIEKSPTQSADVNDSDSNDSQLHALFASWNKSFADNLSLTIGLRSSFYERSKDIYFEPRFNLNYKLSQSLYFRANVGLYTQYVGQVTEFRGSDSGFSLPLWAQAENMSIPVLESGIAQVGFIYKKNSTTIDVQGYYRRTDGLSSRAYNFILDDNTDTKPENGDAEILGIDVLVKKRFGKIRSWISYAYGQVNFDFNRISNRVFPSDYDQRHVVQWANQYNHNQHSFGLGFRYASGLPYSRLTEFTVTSGPNEPFTYNGDYDGINSNRLAGTYEINLSYEYAIEGWKNINAYFNLSLRNILNRENIFERTYTVRTDGNPPPEIVFNDKANLFFTPNLSFRVEW